MLFTIEKRFYDIAVMLQETMEKYQKEKNKPYKETIKDFEDYIKFITEDKEETKKWRNKYFELYNKIQGVLNQE